tara:strand:+ start:138 stop:302 length:165 start_codon:yes stop_codon:yes gene_type:complete
MEDKARYDKVVAYVESNYKQYKNKTLIVKEFDNHFQININKDGSPLILGKGILN